MPGVVAPLDGIAQWGPTPLLSDSTAQVVTLKRGYYAVTGTALLSVVQKRLQRSGAGEEQTHTVCPLPRVHRDTSL